MIRAFYYCFFRSADDDRIIMLLSAFGLFAIGLASIYAAGHPFVSQSSKNKTLAIMTFRNPTSRPSTPPHRRRRDLERQLFMRWWNFSLCDNHFVDYRRLGRPVSGFTPHF